MFPNHSFIPNPNSCNHYYFELFCKIFAVGDWEGKGIISATENNDACLDNYECILLLSKHACNLQ